MAFRITTSAFAPGGSIPVSHTGDGKNKSPLIRWEDAPLETQSFALILEDPDAPGIEPFSHWVIYDIPGEARQLDPDLPIELELPEGIKQGVNDFGGIGYGGPYPPAGERHQYVFRLFALQSPPGLRPNLTRAELLPKLEGQGVLARAEISGFYKSLVRKKKTA